MADRVAVMYLGRIAEQTPTDRLFASPRHPYTAALLASVLTPEPGRGIPDVGFGLAFPNPLEPPPGCLFHPRCARAMAICSQQAPTERKFPDGSVECHLYDPVSGGMIT